MPAADRAPVSVIVVDDHELVVEALDRALASNPSITLVGRATSLAVALPLIAERMPDVVVMDLRLPDGSGIDATRQIRSRHPTVDVVMLTGFADGATLAQALDAGCAGFVSKGGHFDELIEAILAVANGQVRVPTHLLEGLVSHLRPRGPRVGIDLTAREIEILRMLAAGRSTDDIVSALFLSVHTVRNHIRNLLTKLHASSRLEAVAVATRHGLIGGGD